MFLQIIRLYTLLLLCAYTNTLFAQLQLSGQISDALTGEPLIGANLFLATDFSVGSQTDIAGEFSIALKEEKGTLIISYIGYEDQIIDFVQTTSPLRIQMNPKLTTLEAVVVKGDKLTGQVFAVEKIDKLDIYLNPSAQADALKAVQSNAASTTIDETANVSLRGSPAGETGIFLNNVPLNDVVRLDQTNGVGQFSIFNTSTIASVSVFPSNPPLEFGNATSGVVALYTEDALPKKSNALSFNLVGLGASFSRKVKEKTALAVFANWNTPYLLKKVNPTSLADLSTFKTLDFGLYGVHQMNANWQLKFFNYAIDESYQYQVRLPSYVGMFQQVKKRNLSIINLIQQKETTRFEWNQGINFSKAAYQFGNMDIQAQNFDYFSGLNYAWYPEKGSIKIGWNTNIHRVGSTGVTPIYDALDPAHPTIAFDNKNWIIIPEVFLYSKWTIANNFTVGIGGRLHPKWDDLEQYGSYQLNLAYTIQQNHHLIASIGQYHKYQLPNSEIAEINKLSARQYSLDYQGKDQAWKWSLGLYQKENLRGDLPNTVQGIEVYTAYENNQLQWSISLASIQSQLKEEGVSYPSEHDLSYFLRTMLQYEPIPNWAIGLVYWQRQGRYYLPVTTSYYQEDIPGYLPVYSPVQEGLRLPDYHRLDVSISHTFGLPFGTAIVYANANNLLDAKNVRSYNYSADYTNQFAEYLNRRTVFFGVVLNF